MNTAEEGQLTVGELARKQSMLSLLYFVANDYKHAKASAQAANGASEAANTTWTVPAFVLATAMLYDEKVDFNSAIAHFRYSIHGEPANPMVPMLFSVFLDRVMYRIANGGLSATHLDEVAAVGQLPDLRENWKVVKVVILSRQLMQLKFEQQKISSSRTYEPNDQEQREDPRYYPTFVA